MRLPRSSSSSSPPLCPPPWLERHKESASALPFLVAALQLQARFDHGVILPRSGGHRAKSFSNASGGLTEKHAESIHSWLLRKPSMRSKVPFHLPRLGTSGALEPLRGLWKALPHFRARANRIQLVKGRNASETRRRAGFQERFRSSE